MIQTVVVEVPKENLTKITKPVNGKRVSTFTPSPLSRLLPSKRDIPRFPTKFH